MNGAPHSAAWWDSASVDKCKARSGHLGDLVWDGPETNFGARLARTWVLGQEVSFLVKEWQEPASETLLMSPLPPGLLEWSPQNPSLTLVRAMVMLRQRSRDMREEESDACLLCLPATAPCARHSLSVKWGDITTIAHGTGVEIRLDHIRGKARTCARRIGL